MGDSPWGGQDNIHDSSLKPSASSSSSCSLHITNDDIGAHGYPTTGVSHRCFFVGLVQLILGAKQRVTGMVDRIQKMGSDNGGRFNAELNAAELQSQDRDAKSGMMADMMKKINALQKVLADSVHEVPMIAILVFFAHSRVRVRCV